MDAAKKSDLILSLEDLRGEFLIYDKEPVKKPSDKQVVRQYSKTDFVKGLQSRHPKFTEPILTGRYKEGDKLAFSNALTYLYRNAPDSACIKNLLTSAANKYTRAQMEHSFDCPKEAEKLLLYSLEGYVASKAYEQGMSPVILSDIMLNPQNDAERLFSAVAQDARVGSLDRLLEHLKAAQPLFRPYYEAI